METIKEDRINTSCSESTTPYKNFLNTTVNHEKTMPNILRLHDCDILEIGLDSEK